MKHENINSKNTQFRNIDFKNINIKNADFKNIEFKNIEFAYKIYEEKTVTSAAKSLYTSQSSVTKRLIKLEDKLGFRIFKRDYKKMTLTKKGKVFIDDCKEIIDLYNTTLNSYFSVNNYILASNNFIECIKPLNAISKKEEFKNINISHIILSNNKILIELYLRKINFAIFSFINSDYNAIKLFADKNSIKYKIIKKSKIYVYIHENSHLYNNSKISSLDLINTKFIEIENNNISNIKAKEILNSKNNVNNSKAKEILNSINNINNSKPTEILNSKNNMKTIKVNDVYEASVALENTNSYLLGGAYDYNFNSKIRSVILENTDYEAWYLYAYNIKTNDNISLLNKIFIDEIEKNLNLKI